MTKPAKARVDWDEAFAHYLALGPDRTYVAVARQFGVSARRVGAKAKDDGWREEVERIQAERAEAMKAEAIRTLDERQRETIKVANLLRDTILEADGPIDPDVAARVLPQYAKLEQLFAGEATERISVAELGEFVRRLVEVTGRFVPAEARDAWRVAVGSVVDELPALQAGPKREAA